MAIGVIDTSQYDTQLVEKLTLIQSQFESLTIPDIQVYRSPVNHYRYRAEFRVWHDGDDMYHIMFNPEDKSKIRIDQWEPAGKTIFNLMPVLIEKLKSQPALRRKLFQIDYLATLSGEILVSLLYHRQLDADWMTAIQQLKAELSESLNINFIGRARKQKINVERDFVIEKLTVQDREIAYQQIENSFTQPNPFVNQHMLTWACEVTGQSSNQQKDLLELYCGNGNFTLALSNNFKRVIATEIAKSSVKSANYNAELNHIDNVTVLRMSSEEFAEARNGRGKYVKKLNEIGFDDYDINTVLVDPPRAGLDDETVRQISQYDEIVYISCNPDTLKNNLDELYKTHRIEHFAIFDQFPYTHHIESGVKLVRK